MVRQQRVLRVVRRHVGMNGEKEREREKGGESYDMICHSDEQVEKSVLETH